MFNLNTYGDRDQERRDMRHENSDIVAVSSCTDVADNQAVLTGMSHEMRTQMNAVVAFSFLLSKDEYAKEEREDFGNQILQACEQLIELFDNFLDSAIIDTGNSTAETGRGKTDNFLEEILNDFRDTLRKDKYKDILLVTENQVIKREEFLIDTGKVKRVIRNLFQISLSNTRSGYIKIGYNIRDGLFNFYILDSGMGYFKNREFFETSDLSASLGKFNDLYSAINIMLVRKIIGLLGGSIRLECNGLTGTGIYFSVPAGVAENSDASAKKSIKTMINI